MKSVILYQVILFVVVLFTFTSLPTDSFPLQDEPPANTQLHKRANGFIAELGQHLQDEFDEGVGHFVRPIENAARVVDEELFTKLDELNAEILEGAEKFGREADVIILLIRRLKPKLKNFVSNLPERLIQLFREGLDDAEKVVHEVKKEVKNSAKESSMRRQKTVKTEPEETKNQPEPTPHPADDLEDNFSDSEYEDKPGFFKSIADKWSAAYNRFKEGVRSFFHKLRDAIQP